MKIRLGGNLGFNHSATVSPVQVRLIPFFALGFQVISMILNTFFRPAVSSMESGQRKRAMRPLFP
jgi:hypothetical protein